MAITASASGSTISSAVSVVITLGGTPVVGDSVTVSITGPSGTSSAETVVVQQNEQISGVAAALSKILQDDSVISSMVETLLVPDGLELYQAPGVGGAESLRVLVTTGGAQQLVQTLYDLDDTHMTARLKANFPAGWASSDAMQTGVIGALFAVLGKQTAFLLSQLRYARDAARLPTSTEPELEQAADDFFGVGVLPPPAGFSDFQYAQLILNSLFPNANTRGAIENALITLTGVRPRMIEPWNPGDTGCWSDVSSAPWLLNVDFLSAPALPPGSAFVRNSGATYLDQNGNIHQVASNVPRFRSDLGFLIEPVGTNYIRNPMLQSSSTSALPYHWTATSSGGGLTFSAAGYADANTTSNFSSIAVFALGFGGTTSGAASATAYMEDTKTVAAAQGQTWTLSFFCRLSYGSVSGLSLALYLEEEASDGTVLGSATRTITVPNGWPFNLGTMQVSATFSTTHSNTAWVRPAIVVSTTAAGSYNGGIWVAGVQLEQGGGPTSLIVPPDASVTTRNGSMVQSTRQPDSFTMAVPASALWRSPPFSVTAMVEYQQRPGSSGGVPFSLSDSLGTFSTSLYASAATSGSQTYWTVPTSSGLSAVGAGPQSAGVMRLAMAADVSGTSTASEGTLFSDTSAVQNFPQYVLMALGGSWNTILGGAVGSQITGYVRRFALWPSRYTDDKLKQVSSLSWLPGLSASFDHVVSFWDMETRDNPSRWGAPELAWQGFIETPLTVLESAVGIATV